MTKSKKPAKTQTPSRLSDPEVDAALQLIQLSGEDSDENDNNRSSKSSSSSKSRHHPDQEICSGMPIDDSNLDDHAFPPKKRKFRSLLDVYSKTAPIAASKKRGAAAAAGKIKNRRRNLMLR